MTLSLPFIPRTILRSLFAVSPRQITQPTSRRTVHTQFRCRTLQPHLVELSDFMDLSGWNRPYLFVEGEDIRLRYFKHHHAELAFPQNTHGFLYYHHDPGTPRSAGEIRFRITPKSDVLNFAKGADLTIPGYITWSLSLFQLANVHLAPLKDLLVRERLVDEPLIQSMAGKTFRGQKRPLHYLEQPFVLDMQSNNFQFRVFDGNTVAKVRYEWPFRDNRVKVMANPYSGHLLLRFERSTLPEHTNSRIIVLRILKILEEIKTVIPKYDMYLPMPQEGHLLESVNRDRRTTSPFTVDLDKPPGTWKNLNLLVKK